MKYAWLTDHTYAGRGFCCAYTVSAEAFMLMHILVCGVWERLGMKLPPSVAENHICFCPCSFLPTSHACAKKQQKNTV